MIESHLYYRSRPCRWDLGLYLQYTSPAVPGEDLTIETGPNNVLSRDRQVRDNTSTLTSECVRP